MKKVVLFFSLCLASGAAMAQDFGKTLVSGSIGYSSAKSERSGIGFVHDTKTTRFYLNTAVGVFVTPRLAVGILGSYEANNGPGVANFGNDFYEVVENRKTYTAGPFVRLYQPVGGRAAFFGQAAAFYAHSSDRYAFPSGTDPRTTYRGGGASLMPGFVFFPTTTLGLELSLGNISYVTSKLDTDDADFASKESTFGADFGLNNLTLGISLYLGRTSAE